MGDSRASGGFLDQGRETMSQDERRAEQDRRFCQTVELAGARSTAYAEVFAKAGLEPGEVRGLDDLPRLPLMRLADISRRQRQAPPLGGLETRPLAELGRLYVSPGFIAQPGGGDLAVTWAEGLAAAGLGPGQIALNTFSYHLWPFAHLLDEALARLEAVCLPAGPGNTLIQVRMLARLGITAYLGTPGFLLTLAQRLDGAGLDPKKDLSLERAVVGAEMLPESLRSGLSRRLGIPLTQLYGTVLAGCLGYECGQGPGLHLTQDLVVEIVDPATGQPVEPGQAGEVVATNFDPAYPMLRLATGDLSRWLEGSCACGRTGLRLERVLGRVDQAVKVRGTFVHPWQMDEVMAGHREVFKYQAVIERQDDRDRLTVSVELDPQVRAGAKEAVKEITARLEEEIKEHLSVRGRVQVVPPGSIPDFHGKIVDRRKWD